MVIIAKMFMNLFVPSGEVKFVFFDDRENPIIKNRFQEIAQFQIP